jgi:hypothetical protein
MRALVRWPVSVRAMIVLICIRYVTQDPECVDKDLLRRWYVSHCDPYDASLALPEVPADLVAELSRR